MNEQTQAVPVRDDTKKPYSTPRLTTHGDVEKLTLTMPSCKPGLGSGLSHKSHDHDDHDDKGWWSFGKH